MNLDGVSTGPRMGWPLESRIAVDSETRDLPTRYRGRY